MLDPPARLLYFAVVRRDGAEGFLVKIEDNAIGPIANGVGLDLDAAAQGFLQHRAKFFLSLGQEPGSIGIGVRLQERRAARA